MSGTKATFGTIISWVAVALAVFGVISTFMSLAMFEGDERYEGALGWAVFALGAFVVGRIVKRVLAA